MMLRDATSFILDVKAISRTARTHSFYKASETGLASKLPEDSNFFLSQYDLRVRGERLYIFDR